MQQHALLLQSSGFAPGPNQTLLFVAHGGVFDAVHRHLIGPRVGAESQHAFPYVAQPLSNGWTFLPLEDTAA
jgi:hypothetical protein